MRKLRPREVKLLVQDHSEIADPGFKLRPQFMKLNYYTLHKGFLGRHGLIRDRMDRVTVSIEAYKGSHLIKR